jgi:hypothetical protein
VELVSLSSAGEFRKIMMQKVAEDGEKSAVLGAKNAGVAGE